MAAHVTSSEADALMQAGFTCEPVGTHTSRTIMVEALTRLFAASIPEARYDELRALALHNNVLQKPSQAGRFETFRRLRELYGLDPRLPLYRMLRFLWPHEPEEQPMLAMLCALARDPVLRASSEVLLPLAPGMPMPKTTMESSLGERFPGRYSSGVLAGMTRRILSSWTQSGHLSGRSAKTRRRPRSGPASAAYAL